MLTERGSSNLASAADLRSGEIRVMMMVLYCPIRFFDEGDNYPDRRGP